MKEEAKSIIARAVLAILKPLLRVLIKNEISHAEFAELARQAYVDVAYEHFAIPNRKMTYARAAVLTGLSRKEVVRLHALREADNVLIRSSPNRAMRVINGWMSDEEFLDNHGRPATLPVQGQTRSFAALCTRYSGDITLGAVLDELTRVGVASRLDGDRVRLDSQGYIPREDELEKINVLSTCAADLLGSAVHNLEHGASDPRFQRQIVYPSVASDIADQFREHSESQALQLLQELNQLLSSSKTNDKDSVERKRVGLGIYYFESKAKPQEVDNEE
ncbi:MAG: DUF6502 family protein [Granulosicoccus sp.]